MLIDKALIKAANPEKHRMVARRDNKKITMKSDQEEPAEERVEQQKRAESGQFRLQVDRQTKRSFVTYEAAQEAGMAIKKDYPILHVSVYDISASVNTTIELPKTS